MKSKRIILLGADPAGFGEELGHVFVKGEDQHGKPVYEYLTVRKRTWYRKIYDWFVYTFFIRWKTISSIKV